MIYNGVALSLRVTTNATHRVRAIASHPALSVTLTHHAKQRMLERGITMRDIMRIAETGDVLEEPRPTTRDNIFKYVVSGYSLDNGKRKVCLVIIPVGDTELKIVTVYWDDEPGEGSFIR